MSWSPMKPPFARTPGAGRPMAVSVTVHKADAKTGKFMLFVVRPDLFEGGLVWWKVGAAVSVESGAGEHAGMVRVRPDGDWKITGQGTRKGVIPIVRLPIPPDAPREGCRMLPVEFDHGDNWLEITLPAWAKPAAVTPKLITTAQARPAYVGVSERVPDPATTLQAARGGRVR